MNFTTWLINHKVTAIKSLSEKTTWILSLEQNSA